MCVVVIFMSRYFLNLRPHPHASKLVVFLVCNTRIRYPAMFLEHSDGARRLGYSAGSASEVMLTTQANEAKEAKRDRTL